MLGAHKRRHKCDIEAEAVVAVDHLCDVVRNGRAAAVLVIQRRKNQEGHHEVARGQKDIDAKGISMSMKNFNKYHNIASNHLLYLLFCVFLVISKIFRISPSTIGDLKLLNA